MNRSDLQSLVVREFNLLPSTSIDVWLVAADWVEDHGDYFLAHKLREGRLVFCEEYTNVDRNVLVLDSPCIKDNDGRCPGSNPVAVCIDHDGYGDGSGLASGSGIDVGDRYCYCDKYGDVVGGSPSVRRPDSLLRDVNYGYGTASGTGEGDGTGDCGILLFGNGFGSPLWSGSSTYSHPRLLMSGWLLRTGLRITETTSSPTSSGKDD